ncbi:MAG: transposase [Parasporobacterium sp.]|nr:transposase [Parasporobacterium sp.]
MQKGIRFRAYPDRQQQNLINRTLGCCRLIYNKGLAMRDESYRNGVKAGYSQTSAMLTELKKTPDLAFLKEVDSIALQQSLRDLDRGFVNFFQKRASHPQFKSKHRSRQSYRTINQGDNIRIVGRYLKLPKLGYVKIRKSMEVGHINNVTVEKTPSGKYFVVLNVDFEPELRPNNGGTVGIDVGIKDFYTDSNGNVAENPKHLEKSMRKLRREQKKLSRMIRSHVTGYHEGDKGGKIPVYDRPLAECSNIRKQRLKIAVIHEKTANQRNDFLQKQSTMLVRENQTICIEDLNVKGMIRNHKLAQHISSVSWSKFFNMLEYKASWYGTDIIRVPALFPSSQICHCCGYKNTAVKDLSIRTWECPVCRTRHDRDLNASINILNKGLGILA